jgi:hypothetical protein
MNLALLESARLDQAQPPAVVPAAPRTLADTGLDMGFLVELAAKSIFLRGAARLLDLVQQLRLPAAPLEELMAFMRAERVVELLRRGPTQGDVSYALTEGGRQRAAEYLRRCHYVGAAPVTLDAYVDQVRRQSVGKMKVASATLDAAFEGLVVSPTLRERLGAALNSGRPMFLYGPAGSGKTFLAQSLSRMMFGTVAVPHAIVVDGEVIKVFDPKVHRPVEASARAPTIDASGRCDERWVACRRPTVVTGGELRLEMLDLQLDRSSGYYQAPAHVKANNGLFIVDDLGRQLVTPEQLMNRWIVPMDRRQDFLALHTGTTFEIPFDVVLVFATNLEPEKVADEAFLRRIGYKIHVGPVEEGDYLEILQRVCAEFQVSCDQEGVDALLARHRRLERPLLACYPRDLVGMVRDYALYQGTPAEFTAANMVKAWESYFTAR